MPRDLPGDNDLSGFVFPLPNMDADKANADWTKATFDFPGLDTPELFRAYLARLGCSVADFKTLPVYRWNVDKVPWLKEL